MKPVFGHIKISLFFIALLSTTMLIGQKIRPESASVAPQAHWLNELPNFKITGRALTQHHAATCFKGTQSFPCTITYRDIYETSFKKDYHINLNLKGLNIEYSYRISSVFFVNTDLTFYALDKTIELDRGIQLSPFPFLGLLVLNKFVSCFNIFKISTPSNKHEDLTIVLNTKKCILFLLLSRINITYVPFKNTTGGMIIVSLVVSPPIDGLPSIVTGGSLIPVKN